MLSRGAGTHRERLPARPGTAPAGISVERKPRAQLEGSLEGHLEGDSSSEDEELEPGSEDESFEEEPEVFPRSPSPGTPTPPKALAAPAEAVPPVPPPPADAGDLELRHEAATVNLAEAPSASVQAGHSEDDEFDYAFTGAAREAPGHVETFKAAPLPAHLVSDTKGLLREGTQGPRTRHAKGGCGPRQMPGSERRSGSGRPLTRGPKAGPLRTSARRFVNSRQSIWQPSAKPR